jgi:SAM-dependent methyltransferase
MPCCPLCDSSADQYHQDKRRAYFQCANCRLVFVSPDAFLTAEEEKSIYDLHQNSPGDEGYRTFLSRMCRPITERLPTGSRGLDFGCGPGPTLSVMFEEFGYPMALYDSFYAPDKSALAKEYDFVTATEVVEHLRNPAQSLDRMWRCVKPGGYLGIMTKLVIDRDAFANWHYKNDDTHICFYSRETFGWLAREWRTEPVFVGKDVTIFRKDSSYTRA